MNPILTPVLAQAGSLETGSIVYALVAVATLWIALEIIGKLNSPCCGGKCDCDSHSEKEETESCCCHSSAAPAPSVASSTVVADEAELHAAVIAAAVAAVIDKPHRIGSISYAGDVSTAWSREGRREIYASHRIR